MGRDTLYSNHSLVQCKGDPMNLTPYRSIEANRSKEMEWHHLFPVSRFKTDAELSKFLKNKDDSAVNFIGNMVHISKESNRRIGNEMPASYIIPMKKTRENELKMNFLKDTSFKDKLFEPANIKDILESRASLIQKQINSFLKTIESGGNKPEQTTKLDPFDLIRTNRSEETQTIEYKETLRVHTKRGKSRRKMG